MKVKTNIKLSQEYSKEFEISSENLDDLYKEIHNYGRQQNAPEVVIELNDEIVFHSNKNDCYLEENIFWPNGNLKSSYFKDSLAFPHFEKLRWFTEDEKNYYYKSITTWEDGTQEIKEYKDPQEGEINVK